MEATCNSPAHVNIFGQHVRRQAPNRHGFLRVSLGERPTNDGFPIYVLAFWREYIYMYTYHPYAVVMAPGNSRQEVIDGE